MSFLLAVAVASAATPRVDHTDDIAVVARFLADVRSGKGNGAGIEVVNYRDRSLANFPAFVAYANACEIRGISAVTSTQRLPVGVKWDCGRYIQVEGKPVWEERSASFWVKGGRIVKLTFDTGPTVVIPAPKAETHG